MTSIACYLKIVIFHCSFFIDKVTCDDRPCNNAGTCVDDVVRGFQCVCTVFWTGDKCETGNLKSKDTEALRASVPMCKFIDIINLSINKLEKKHVL